MLEACFIARINAILIDESTATIYSYANDKMKELREMEIEQSKVVGFIDIGYAKTTITIAKFYYTGECVKAEILYKDTDRDLGGRDLDYLMFQQYLSGTSE